jgi:hypothetical protein
MYRILLLCEDLMPKGPNRKKKGAPSVQASRSASLHVADDELYFQKITAVLERVNKAYTETKQDAQLDLSEDVAYINAMHTTEPSSNGVPAFGWYVLKHTNMSGKHLAFLKTLVKAGLDIRVSSLLEQRLIERLCP